MSFDMENIIWDEVQIFYSRYTGSNKYKPHVQIIRKAYKKIFMIFNFLIDGLQDTSGYKPKILQFCLVFASLFVFFKGCSYCLLDKIQTYSAHLENW